MKCNISMWTKELYKEKEERRNHATQLPKLCDIIESCAANIACDVTHLCAPQKTSFSPNHIRRPDVCLDICRIL